MNDPTGIGLGFRLDFAKELLERRPPEIEWLEIHPENYIGRGGRYRARLEQIRAHWPLATHGLTMGFGGTEPFDPAYLARLRGLLTELEIPWHSDHLCFGGAGDAFAHDLLPIPYAEETVDVVLARHREASDALGVPVAIENVSTYAPSPFGAFDELTFLLEVLERADAPLLLDVNNVLVNANNHGFDPAAFLARIPGERIVQIHVAGHFVRDDGLRIDTHGEPVPDDVYALLEGVLSRVGPKPVLLERDNAIPPLDDLLDEVRRLRALYDRAVGRWQTAREGSLERHRSAVAS